ncbi:MAG: helix-turn-helix domain-containing protein [Alistipes finegoldii]|jgi:DNA-binding helix-turn-helix protein|uniref:helix-turn-helix domain-containing protein n=1 Tax=Alistipes finegoldii TaxID=214856 RepID=UPI00399C6FD7
MMNIQERLEELRRYTGLSVNAFAGKIGISRQRLANYLSDRDPDYDVLCRICQEFPMINSEWLLIGVGKIEKESPVEGPDSSGLGGDNAVKMILERDEKLIRENERLTIYVQQLERELKHE